MSEAQERRREEHIESAKAELDTQLTPYYAQQKQLCDQIAKAPTAELQQQLDAITYEIGQIMEGSLWWRLYQKD